MKVHSRSTRQIFVMFIKEMKYYFVGNLESEWFFQKKIDSGPFFQYRSQADQL